MTHAFVGAAMAEYAVPRGAAPRTRLAMMTAGVLAANAPDVDLLYTAIVEEPLGYLLHQRGHSHTLPGLAAIAQVIWAGVRLLPFMNAAVRGIERRWMILIAAALGSHLLMDTANGYGTHLFYPWSSGWVYGDAVFVLEPWCWAVLGTMVTLNAGRRGRILVGGLTLALLVAVGVIGLLDRLMLAVMLASVSLAALAVRGWERPRRAAAGLVAVAVFFAGMIGVSRAAKASARTLAGVEDSAVVDVLADANPGVPWCWSVLVLERAAADPSKTLVARRSTLSLVPRVWSAASCASARLWARSFGDLSSSSAVVWHRRWEIDLDELRRLAGADCRARAWLQFGRVPYLSDGRLVDLRFDTPIGQNFTSMPLRGGSECPAYLTNWEPPRGDVLNPPPDRR